jgi:hypothetical protein
MGHPAQKQAHQSEQVRLNFSQSLHTHMPVGDTTAGGRIGSPALVSVNSGARGRTAASQGLSRPPELVAVNVLGASHALLAIVSVAGQRVCPERKAGAPESIDAPAPFVNKCPWAEPQPAAYRKP